MLREFSKAFRVATYIPSKLQYSLMIIHNKKEPKKKNSISNYCGI